MKLSAFFCSSSRVGRSFNFSFSWLLTWTKCYWVFLTMLHTYIGVSKRLLESIRAPQGPSQWRRWCCSWSEGQEGEAPGHCLAQPKNIVLWKGVWHYCIFGQNWSLMSLTKELAMFSPVCNCHQSSHWGPPPSGPPAHEKYDQKEMKSLLWLECTHVCHRLPSPQGNTSQLGDDVDPGASLVVLS